MPFPKQPKISPEDYREFINQIELQHIVLASASIKRHGVPTFEGTLSYDQKPTKREYESSANGFEATLHYLVELREEGNDQPFGEIRTAFTASYRSEEEMTDVVFDVFGELNLPVNVYPYIREFVHSSTARMGFPGLVLPTLKRV